MRLLAAVCLLLAGCRSTCSTAGSSRVDRLIAQLEGRCCEFVARYDSCRELGFAEFMTHPQLECVRSAALCLGKLGPAAAPAVPALLRAARSGPNNYDTGDGVIHVRDAIIESLGRTGDARVLDTVIEALDNPRPPDAGPGSAGYASRTPNGEIPALQALAHLGPAARPAVPKILPFLQHADERLIIAAVHALEAIGDPAVLPALIRLIEESPDRYGEVGIRQAIRRIAGPATADALPESYAIVGGKITKLLRQTARRHRIRLRRLHVDGPNEETSATLPSGVTVIVRFGRAQWLAGRQVTGTAGRTGELRPFASLRQLEDVLDREFARP
jgi:hypothetical protein